VRGEDSSDEIIIRADGSPMYNFVVVCDDIAMKITDVIRGQDHLPNTHKQIAIYDALGASRPRFSHIPLIFGPNGKKLSKRAPVLRGKDKKGELVYVSESKEVKGSWDVLRKGERSVAAKDEITDLQQVMSLVDEYREAGFLPEAVLNYLVLLGWGYDDKTEIFSKDFLVENFDINKVSSSAAQFDPVKLEHFQGLYMRKFPDAEFEKRIADELTKAQLVATPPSADDQARIALLAKAEKERLTFFADVASKSRIFFTDEVTYDAKAAENLKKRPDAPELLEAYASVLEGGDFADSKALEEQARSFSKEKNVKFGELVHPVRAALTGATTGAGLFDVIRLTGKKRALERLRRAAAWVREKK
jgi:glutamyl/glutaminyl-tRNA synthetase